MAVRALVANRTRRIIGEIEPELGPVSWRLNKVGKATFRLPGARRQRAFFFLQGLRSGRGPCIHATLTCSANIQLSKGRPT